MPHAPAPDREQIIETPYYSAYLYYGQAIGIELKQSATDGDPLRKVKDTKPTRDEHGNISQYVIADSSTRTLWLQRLGRILAQKLVKDDLRNQGDRWRGNSNTAVMADLPKDYELYVHRSQREYDPRKDTYLFGSRYVTVFRSPAEFGYHLLWLASGSPMKPDGTPDCDCAYCNPSRTQLEISHELGLRHKDPHSPTIASGKGTGKGKDRAGKGRARRKRSPSPASIPAKDYTKLNLQSS